VHRRDDDQYPPAVERDRRVVQPSASAREIAGGLREVPREDTRNEPAGRPYANLDEERSNA